MKRITIISALLLMTALPSWAGDDTENTGGIWTELGVTKTLPYNLSLDVDLEYRTEDWFDRTARWNVGAGLGYKLGKNFKFGLSYTYIDKHYQDKTKIHYDGTTGYFDGWNIDHANWASRHRIALDVTATKKFWKTLRISLRERYQYTHQPARTVDRTKLRVDTTQVYDGTSFYDVIEVDTTYTTDRKSVKNRHLLRSRLKFSIDKKGWKWEPYVSVETHNDFSNKMHLDKIRMAAGVEYSISKQHKIGLGYIFNHENDDDGDQNVHAINIGYRYKF